MHFENKYYDLDALYSHKKIVKRTRHSCFHTHAYYFIILFKIYSKKHYLKCVNAHAYCVDKQSYVLRSLSPDRKIGA